MRTLAIIVVLFFCAGVSKSTSQDLANTLKQDTLAILEHLKKAQKARSSQWHYAKEHAEQALALAKKHKLHTFMAKSHGILGGILSLGDSPDDIQGAIIHTEQALTLFRALGDSSRVQRCYLNLSNAYSSLYSYPQALDMAYHAVRLAHFVHEVDSSKRNTDALASTYGTLARVYSGLALSDSAIHNYEKAFNFFKQTDSPLRFIIAANLGDILHYERDDYEAALDYYELAYRGGKTINYQKTVVNMALGIGKIRFELEKYDSANKYFKEAYAIADSNDFQDSRCSALLLLAQNADARGHADSAMLYIDHALLYSDSIAQLKTKINVLDLKARLLDEAGDQAAALTYFKKAQQWEDTLRAREDLPASTYALMEKQNQSYMEREEAYETILTQKNTSILLAIIGLLVAGLVSFWAIKKQRMRLSQILEDQESLKQKHQEDEEEKSEISRKLVSITANLALQNELLAKTNKLLNEIQK